MSANEQYWCDHEKLEVYSEAIGLIAWLDAVLETAQRLGDVRSQLDRASVSIVLNIAEGNGKYLAKDRCHYLDIARGSALECAAALDVLVAKRKLTTNEIIEGKQRLQRIVRMLI